MGFITLTLVYVVLLFVVSRVPKEIGDRYGEAVKTEKPKRWVAIGLTAIFALITLSRSVFVVNPGDGHVGMMFGNLFDRAYGPGIHMTLPVVDRIPYSVRRLAISFESSGAEEEDKDDLLAQTSDRVPVTIDVTFAYQLNLRWLPWIYQHVGGPVTLETSLLRSAARTAVRPAVARFTMDQALGTSGRIELAQAMQSECTREIVTSLRALGLSEEQAQQAVTCLPVLLRRVEPPDAVQQAQAERQAAQIGVETAGLVVQRETRLAEAQAARGQGLTNLQQSAPRGWTPAEIADVVRAQAVQTAALADQQTANALQAAVDGGRVQVMVMSGDGAVQVPQPSTR